MGVEFPCPDLWWGVWASLHVPPPTHVSEAPVVTLTSPSRVLMPVCAAIRQASAVSQTHSITRRYTVFHALGGTEVFTPVNSLATHCFTL